MALITTGSIVTDLKGRLGGHVFQRTLGGLMVRTERSHVNPKLPFQLGQRNLLQQMLQIWNSMSDTQRKAWDVYAVFRGYPQRKNTGNTLSGQMCFVKENILRQSGILPLLAIYSNIMQNPVMLFPPPQLNVVSVVNTAGVLSVTFDSGYDLLSYYPILYLSRSLTASQRSQNNKYQVMKGFTIPAGVYTITAQYVEKFGVVPPVGAWLNWKICNVPNAANGSSNFTSSRLQVT